MKTLLNSHIMFAIHMLIIALVIAIASWSVYAAKDDLRMSLHALAQQRQAQLIELAIQTDRNDADEVIAQIITDCPSRTEFEQLLARLHALAHSDLIRVQQHFDACGNFYAERKALMVDKLGREYAALQEYVRVLDMVTEIPDTTYNLEQWGTLVDLEYDRSALLNEQVVIQLDIITALISGVGLQSEAIKQSLSRAQEIAESLSVLDKKIDGLREQVTA